MATIAISAPASLARGLARGVAVRAGASAKTTLVPRAVRRDEIRVGGFASRRGVAARAVDGDEKTKDSKDVLDSLSSILGIDPEEELRAQRAEEERVEKELREAREEQDAARAARAATEAGKTKPPVVTRAVSSDSGSDEDTGAADRAIAALSYLLPLLDGLKYSKFLLMQFPLFGLALLPLKPAIDLWYGLGFLQIAVFFGLYLGVVQNQEMKYFTRYNAQQAVLLDILLIVPDVLARLASGLGGDDALLTGGPGLEIQVLMYNTVFLYVYLSSVVGVGASALGKNVKLPLVGDAAESQTNMR
mmetsp:Transcript_13631/g.57288  ORF Transcript_13631/g.57288 Transcript_13631/m.57288 type:complete len:304 (-) Transcript_13631:2433-3344(-)